MKPASRGCRGEWAPPLTRRGALAALTGAALLRGEDGWVDLFDGRSLEGWTVADGPESAFHVVDGAIAVHRSGNYPAWLRSARQYENFEFRGEFFLKGWMDSAIYLHAPEHGRNTWCGLAIKLFHQKEEKPTPYSCGAVFPLVAPRLVNVRNQGEWNAFRIRLDWPRLEVWMNGERVQDVDLSAHPDLRYRLRRGYLGLESLSYPIRFRNLALRELPSKERWETLYGGPADLAHWKVSEGKPRMEGIGGVLRLEGLGHIQTASVYRDFELESYVRTSRSHNGGILFRSLGGGTAGGKNYEIQLHNVEGAHYPTGSLYHHKRAVYPRIEDERWWLLQMWAEGPRLVVRINGENVLEYDQLAKTDAGFVELQAHAEGTWVEFKGLRIKKLAE